MRTLYKVAALAAFVAATPAAYAAVDADEQAEIDALQSARVSLEGAVAAALREVPGSAVEAGLEVGQGLTAYEVTIQGTKQRTLLRIDPRTGAVLGKTLVAGPPGHGRPAGADGAEAPQPIGLGAAIAAAQRHSPGQALEASLEPGHGLHYEVGVVRDGRLEVLRLDPQGRILGPAAK